VLSLTREAPPVEVLRGSIPAASIKNRAEGAGEMIAWMRASGLVVRTQLVELTQLRF